ncbi:MAG: anhydro-N-acetylmuramic acid kinase [Betaproteobacteria bacterium]|nr:anhydro-N-acetylmuramic acid kinase [Betaproteobacteria bacterium]
MPSVAHPPLKPISNNPHSPLYIGLMSGTSMDGVDGVLVDFSSSFPQVVRHAHLPFNEALKKTLIKLNYSGETPHELEIATTTAIELSHLYAQCVNQLKDPQETIRAIGCHGQTIRHQPDKGFTIQLVNGALLAELTGIDTLCDFRARDIAAGGQGAPLVPRVHQAWFSTDHCHRVIVNLGGIANITNLDPHASVIGFDCGPANILLDEWIRHCKGVAYDKNGAWGRLGQVNNALLNALLTHPFLAMPPPKSTGREAFNLNWLLSFNLVHKLTPEDVQATLTEFTTLCVARAIQPLRGNLSLEVVLCGGGALNQLLVERLAANLPNVILTSTDQLGIPVDQVEATAFAWFAMAFDQRIPGNLVSVTGAKHPVVLGTLYPA